MLLSFLPFLLLSKFTLSVLHCDSVSLYCEMVLKESESLTSSGGRNIWIISPLGILL